MPLSDPATASPDPGLVGTWTSQDPETGEWIRLTILAFDDHQMVAFGTGDGSEPAAFRLFPTQVGGQGFLNIQELGTNAQDAAGQEAWYFAHYEIAERRLRLKVVDDALFDNRQFVSSAELRQFVGLHLSDPLLYAPEGDEPQEMTWERVSDPGAAP